MLSHHHKTIFVHIPKCAGQSVEMAFLADLGLGWETRAPLLLRPNDRRDLGPPRLAHLVAADYVNCRYTPQEMFDSYFKFAIVRNPWTRAVSLYRHLGLDMPFRDFVADWLSDQFARPAVAESYWFVRPQTEFVFSGDALLVDEVIRFEALAEQFPRIAAAAALLSPLPHVNRTGDLGAQRASAKPWLSRLRGTARSRFGRSRHIHHDDWRDYYTDEAAEGIARLYHADTAAFGYAFPCP